MEAKILDAASGSVRLSATQRFPVLPASSSSSSSSSEAALGEGGSETRGGGDREEAKSARREGEERKMKEKKRAAPAHASRGDGDEGFIPALLIQQNLHQFAQSVPDVLIAPSSFLEMLFYSLFLPFLLVIWPLYQVIIKGLLSSLMSRSGRVRKIALSCCARLGPSVRERSSREEDEEEQVRGRLVLADKKSVKKNGCTRIEAEDSEEEEEEGEETRLKKNKET